MHYKSFIFAALAGSLVLSSCVKDLETKSVTDIRNAKLEEIKSQTALNNAKAASEKSLSEAEALLKAAQAEAQKAQAAYIKAQTEYQQALTAGVLIDNQKKAADLEAALINAEIAKKQAQADLERLALDLEAQLLNAQAQLINAQTNYASAQNSKLTTLANAYASATLSLINAQNQLVSLKAQLTSAENGLVDIKESQAKLIADNNAQIAVYEKILEAYKESLGMTPEEVTAKVRELTALQAEKMLAYQKANDSYNVASNELWDARNEMNNYAFANVYSALNLNVSTSYYSYFTSYSSTSVGDMSKYKLNYTDVDGKTTQSPIVSLPNSSFKTKYSITTVKDGKNINLYYSNGLREYSKGEVLDASVPASVAATAKEVIAEQHDNNVKNTQTNVNNITAYVAALEKAIAEYDSETKSLDDELESLNKKEVEANAEYQAAIGEYTEYIAEKYTALYSAQTALNEVKNNRMNLESAISSLEMNIKNYSQPGGYIEIYENSLAYAISDIAVYKKQVETREADVKTAKVDYEAQLEVVAPLETKKNEAYAAYREKNLAYMAGTLTDYTEVSDAYSAYTTAESAWAAENATLLSLKSALDAAVAYLDSSKSSLKNAETNKTRYESYLKQYKATLANYEKELAAKKSELESVLVAEKKAEESYDAAYAATNSSTDSKLADLIIERTKASNARSAILAEIAAIENKISNIQNTNKRISYSYDDLVNECKFSSSTTRNYSSCVTSLDSYKSYLENDNNNLATMKSSFEEANKQIDEWLEKLTTALKSQTEYASAIDALNALETSSFEAFKANDTANREYNEVNAALSALQVDESAISNYVNQIETLKRQNANTVSVSNQEGMIERLKVQIANQEQIIEAYTKAAEIAKANLDAALAETNSNE